MITSHEIDWDCPTCGQEFIALVEAVSPAPEIGRDNPDFGGQVMEQTCACAISDKQLSAIAETYFEGLSED